MSGVWRIGPKEVLQWEYISSAKIYRNIRTYRIGFAISDLFRIIFCKPRPPKICVGGNYHRRRKLGDKTYATAAVEENKYTLVSRNNILQISAVVDDHFVLGWASFVLPPWCAAMMKSESTGHGHDRCWQWPYGWCFDMILLGVVVVVGFWWPVFLEACGYLWL